jgi:hypothetical protein
MDTPLHRGNHDNTCDTSEKAMKGKILGWIAAASEVCWRSEENETKIPFQSCGNRTSELEMPTGENQSEIQVILNDKDHTPHTTQCSNTPIYMWYT